MMGQILTIDIGKMSICPMRTTLDIGLNKINSSTQSGDCIFHLKEKTESK